MSWQDIIKETPEEAKANEAKEFVLSQATKGMTMEQAVRLFAQKFPAQMPPNVEEQIKRAREFDEAIARLDASRKKLEEVENRKNPFSQE
tara:strand:- start:2653 stop:2922 length:270 start_codon:yes stop_codon:yes gene_type:complete